MSKTISLLQKDYNSKVIGEWYGTVENEMLFMELYIIKKYSHLFHYLPFVNIVLQEELEYNPSRYFLGVSDYNNKFGKGFDFTYDKFDKKDYEKYFDLYRNTKKRFTLFNVGNNTIYKDGSRDGHSLIIIYDKKFNELEIFDSAKQSLRHYKPLIKIFFEEIYGKELKIIYPFFPTPFGVLGYKKCKDFKFTSDGFCTVWSLWYIEYRLKNPNKSRQQLIENAIEKFNKGDTICRVIRGYSIFIQNTIKNYHLDVDYKRGFVLVVKDKSKTKSNKKLKIVVPAVLISALGIGAAVFYIIKKLKFKKDNY
jgi:hypothetical protein